MNLDLPYIEIRHLMLPQIDFPRFALGDDRAIIFYFDTLDSKRILDPGKAFWTNNLAFIRSMKLLFNELWRKSIDIRERIGEFEGIKSAFITSQNQKSLSQLSFVDNLREQDTNFYKKGHYRCGNHKLAKSA